MQRWILLRRETGMATRTGRTTVMGIGLIALVLITAALWQRRREQRIAGEHARAQVILALRITNSTLDAILQQKLQHPTKEAQP